MDEGGGGSPPMRPGVVGEGHGRSTRASYLRRQVGDTRTLMRSVGSATIDDLLLTTVADPFLVDCRRPNFDVCRRPDSD